jgi:hypothetical protein
MLKFIEASDARSTMPCIRYNDVYGSFSEGCAKRGLLARRALINARQAW